MELFSIDELVGHCLRSISGNSQGSVLYKEHVSTKYYLEVLLSLIDLNPSKDLSDLTKALSEGRIKILPCKEGTTVVRAEVDKLGELSWFETPFRISCMDLWGEKYFSSVEQARRILMKEGED